MGTAHVLLGRPWLFDKRVIHDGYSNCYAFKRHGKSVLLRPMIPREIRIAQGQLGVSSGKGVIFIGRLNKVPGISKYEGSQVIFAGEERGVKHLRGINTGKGYITLCTSNLPLQVFLQELGFDVFLKAMFFKFPDLRTNLLQL